MSLDKSLFEELHHHLLTDEKPSQYLRSVVTSFSTPPFTMLSDLQKTKQSPIHHPEGDAWEHTLLVVDEAAKLRGQSKDPAAFMWAALLHDIGKPSTTRSRKGRITSYDHDRVGGQMAQQFMSCFTDDQGLIQRVGRLVRYHMHILFVLKQLPFSDIPGMIRDVDLKELALLGYCDRVGRAKPDIEAEKSNVARFVDMIEGIIKAGS